jgi:Rrf2 family protein
VLFSKTQEYAIQALIHLAVTPDTFQLNRDLAAHLGLPAPYLAKVLKRLTQLGFLDSAKGRGGGYRVQPRALRASVGEIVAAVDGAQFEGCVLGLAKCSEAVACPLHQQWIMVRTKLLRALDGQSLAQLATTAKASRSRLAPQRRAAATVRQLSAIPPKSARR